METQVISSLGPSNPCMDYDSVEYLNRSNQVIYSARIIYSDRVKNGFLGMMNADFADSNSNISESDGDIDLGSMISLSDYPKEWKDPISMIESLSAISVMQYTKEMPSYNYEVYSYVEKSKLTVLRLPKNCTSLRLYNSKTSDEYIIDFVSDNLVPSADGLVEKMVILSIAQNTQTNFSPKIHEALDAPHSLLKDKILLSSHFYDSIILFEVDKDKLMDTKGNVRLGDYLIDYDELDTVESLVVGEGTTLANNIIVNNKVVCR